MKMGSMKYLVGEGVKNTWVNRLMSLASVGVLVACMVIIGLAILISENVNKAVGNLEQQNVVMAYMKDYSWALYGDKDASSDTSSADSSAAAASSGAASSAASSSENTSSEEKADENGIKQSDYIVHSEEEAKALCDEIAKLDNVASVTYVSPDEALASIKSQCLKGRKAISRSLMRKTATRCRARQKFR